MSCSKSVKRGQIYNWFWNLCQLVMRNIKYCHLVQLKHHIWKISKFLVFQIEMMIMIKLSKKVIPRIILFACSRNMHLDCFLLFSLLLLFVSKSHPEIKSHSSNRRNSHRHQHYFRHRSAQTVQECRFHKCSSRISYPLKGISSYSQSGSWNSRHYVWSCHRHTLQAIQVSRCHTQGLEYHILSWSLGPISRWMFK